MFQFNNHLQTQIFIHVIVGSHTRDLIKFNPKATKPCVKNHVKNDEALIL